MQNVIRTCAPQPSRSPSKPDRYAAQAAGAASSTKNTATAPTDILLVIVPGYSLLSLGCIVEPLTAAQTLATVQPFELSLYDLGPGATSAEKEFRISAARALPELESRISARPAPGAIFFCCGFDVPHHARAPLRRVMRQARRAGIPIFGIGAATWALAETDLLPDRKGVVHWTSLSAFKERNPDADPLPKLYHTNPQVSTCAGELATLDMVIDFARQTFGKEVADLLCDRFLISRPRGPEADQPSHRASLLRYAPQIVQDTVGRMSGNLENPVGINALAEAAGVSQRQLERLFGQYLNTSPRKFYCDLQLGLAWQLCEQTDLPVVEIALAAGFSSHAALSRKFKIKYSITPSEMRARARVLRRPPQQNIAVIGAVEGTA